MTIIVHSVHRDTILGDSSKAQFPGAGVACKLWCQHVRGKVSRVDEKFYIFFFFFFLQISFPHNITTYLMSGNVETLILFSVLSVQGKICVCKKDAVETLACM